MFHRILSVAILFAALPFVASAQPKTKLVLDDGSIVRCQLLTPSLTIATGYGELTVPISDVSKIRFGLHPTPAEQKQLDDAPRSLASPIFRDREVGRKTLQSLGRVAVPALRRASKSPDREVSVAATALLLEIADKDPRDVQEHDLIDTKEFAVKGKIKAESLAFRSGTLGDFSVPLGKIEALSVIGVDHATIALDAAKHGSALDQWLGTGLHVDIGMVVSIKAEGQVDLWPQAPGQYMATPKGYNTVGKGGQFLAGALIGRVGNGQPFMIGDSTSITARESGELRLLIVPSPWNNAASGSYSVTAKISDR